MSNPLAWLLGLGKQVGEAAEGGGKALDQMANNTGNRVVIGLLVGILILRECNHSSTQTEIASAKLEAKKEVDSLNARERTMFINQHQEDVQTKKDQAQEIKDMKVTMAQQTVDNTRMRTALEICQSKK